MINHIYSFTCTQLYTTGAVLRDDQSHLLITYTVHICTVYTIIPYTTGAILRNYKSSIFNNTINQYIHVILIITIKGAVFFSYCINKLLTYISTLYDIQLSVTYKKCCFLC